MNTNATTSYLSRLFMTESTTESTAPSAYPPEQAILLGLQPYDDNLYAIASLSGTTGYLRKTGAGLWTLDNTTYLTEITSSQITTALGYIPENAANKGIAGGYASLDSGGLIPASQLPSYVDDVLEYPNLASFPNPGVQGKIYVDVSVTKIYRWSGSTYIEITPTVGESDPVFTGSPAYGITSTNISNWNTAYGWGNHASVGYLTSFTETDPVFLASAAAGITTTNISNWNTAYGWGNHGTAGYLTSFTETDPVWTAEKINYYTKLQADARYLQSFTETDPIYTASSWYTTTNNSANWNTAYSWGNHASAGYAVTTTGTVNYVPRYTAGNTLGNSIIYASATGVGINTTVGSGQRFSVGGYGTGAASYKNIISAVQIFNDVTEAMMYYSQASIISAPFTLNHLYHYVATEGSLSGSATVTNQYGFYVTDSLYSAVNNYAFHGNVIAGTGRWNIYMAGTAANYMNGSLSIGTTATTYKVNIAGDLNLTTGSVFRINGSQISTANVIEGANLYYTDTRARSAISSTVTGLTYNTTTGVLSSTAGYSIPTTTSQTNWDTAYGWGNHASVGYLTGITFSHVTTALGYTPYNSSNPAGYITSSSLGAYLPLSGGTITGIITLSGSSAYFKSSSTLGFIVNNSADTFNNLTVKDSTGNTYIRGQVYVGGDGNSTGTQLVYNSGTWGISVTGNAATATVLQTARTINGTSFNGSADINTTEWFHSDRDFPSGTLITTSINYAVSSGDPFVLEIRGNSYGGTIPLDIQYQGYIYADTIINHGGLSNGLNISGLVAINVDGNLCFWFPTQGYWNGYNVKVYTAYATRAVNRVTSITGTSKPASTKEVVLNIRQSLHSDNYTLYSPSLTGSGASGTWGINITGTAGAVAWTNVSGRPTTVSSFTNDSGYVTSSGSVNYATSSGNADTVDGYHASNFIGYNGNSYYQVSTWLQMNGIHGMYWPSYYGAHIYANDGGSYGAIRINGSKNGWKGIYFDSGTTLMMNANESGHYGEGAGWQFRWYQGTLYTSRSTYGGGTEYTVLDSGNYNSYSPTLTGGGASGTWGISISGNAATATLASQATTNYDASAGWYPVVWRSGNTLYYSGVEIYAGGNYLRAQYINTTDDLQPGITRFVIKNGDDYHRSVTTTTAADVIRGAASGSWNVTAARATRANGNFYIDDNYGNGIVGVYSSVRYQGVFAMGDAYKLSADGTTTGSLYGLAWSHPNAGGVAANLNTHGLLVMENGSFLAAISGSIRARDDVQAPALYDSGSRVAISRGEGRNYVDYSRYVYNNGAYSGSGWVEPSDLGVRYANSAGSANSVAWTNVSGRPTAVSSFTNDSGYITSGGRAYPRRSDGGDLNFYWSGQSGQPSWLWGGNDGTNMYVWNPSNFSVNYATTAGTASNISAYTINQNLGTGNSPTFSSVNTTDSVTSNMFVNNALQIRSSTSAPGATRIVSHFKTGATGGTVNMIQLTNLTNTVIHYKVFFGSNDSTTINSAWNVEAYGSVYFNGSGSANEITATYQFQNGNGNNGSLQFLHNPSGYSNSLVLASGNSTGGGGITLSMTVIFWGKDLQSATINYL